MKMNIAMHKVSQLGYNRKHHQNLQHAPTNYDISTIFSSRQIVLQSQRLFYASGTRIYAFLQLLSILEKVLGIGEI